MRRSNARLTSAERKALMHVLFSNPSRRRVRRHKRKLTKAQRRLIALRNLRKARKARRVTKRRNPRHCRRNPRRVRHVRRTARRTGKMVVIHGSRGRKVASFRVRSHKRRVPPHLRKFLFKAGSPKLSRALRKARPAWRAWRKRQLAKRR